ncbi:MAG: alternative ribosome rescue aminoacyl-tRNA hydrolase ArfB [bacterium]
MIKITQNVSIRSSEVELSSIRSQGKGGQNVNKVSSAIHLRFDIKASSLPEVYKERLLNLKDSRVSKQGVFILKAQTHRTREQNIKTAIERLVGWIQSVSVVNKVRRATKPTKGSQKRRMDSKTKRSQIKSFRGKVLD